MYSTHVMTKATALESLVGQKPANVTVDYINNLKRVLQAAVEQQVRMEEAYCEQSHLIKPEQANEHAEIFTATNTANGKAAEAAEGIIYGWLTPEGPAPPQLQAPAVPRIVEDLKPKEVLASSASIERFRHWRRQYEAIYDQNETSFDKQGIKVARAYLNGAIDAKMAARLATLEKMRVSAR